MEKPQEQKIAAQDEALESWVKPQVESYAPVKAAEGIFYNRGDGLTNMTP
ncbi:hypothetical protein [Sphingomonas sp. G-3-2-10]|nr:hypothetical protein [Sphingomonas sp. G-3-2-10]NML04894.1 hypothetical protein [Sphingomonas sp. G-3-2-10]